MDLCDSPSNLLMLGKTCNIVGFIGIREERKVRHSIHLRIQSCLVAKPNLELKLSNSKALPHRAMLLLSMSVAIILPKGTTLAIPGQGLLLWDPGDS